MNDNQLPSELSESDDTYKLNLDNEYAVKNLVKLGSQTSDANTFPLSNYNLSDIKRMNLIEDSISNSEENSNSLDTLSLVTSMGQESKDITNNTNPWAQFKNEENRNQNIIVSPNEQCFTSAFSISQNDLIQSTTLTNSNFEGSFLKVSHNSEIQIKSNKLGNSSMEEELKDIPNVLNPWAQFIANENLNQKVVVLPNEQYFTPSFSLSQNDFIQTTTLPASSIDGDIILLKESPELHIKNEPTKSDTSLIASIKQESKCIANDEKSIDLDKKNESVKPDTSKYNIKRNKRPKKITQKDSIDNDDFLPKRTYSRTVLRAPFKKNPTNSADHKKIMHQNKVMQPLEAGLDVKPSSTLPIIEKSLPDVNSLLNTETVQKDLKQNSKEIPTDLPPKKLQLELPRCENKSKSPIQNPSETPNPSGSIVEKPSAAVKESKKSEVEVKNFSLETLSKASPNTTLKTKEIVSNSIKVSDNMPVYCSSADLVKLRKRAVTNRYSSNYISPSPAKELKSEMAKSKKTLQKSSLGRSRANTPEVKTNVESLQERKNHREQKSLTDNLLEKCLKSGTPKLQLLHENKVLHTETKTNVRVCRLGDASSIDNKSNLQSSTAPLEGSSRKYNYSIDSILRKEPKPNSIHLNENSIKDCRQSKGQGLKRSLPTTTDDNESQKKQMKIAFLEPRQSSTTAKNNEKLKKPTKGSLQSENNSDKTFDSLFQQGNVNELIHLRVTEDNKLKTERKCNLSLKQSGNEMEFKLKMERGSSRSRDQIDVVKKEAERRNSPLMKSHSRDKDDEFDKLGSARSSQLMKVSSRNKEQSEHNKHVRSSFHSSYSRPRETSSTRSREDVRSDCNKTYSSLRSHKAREQHYSDYSRKRKAYYSDHIRGREAHHSGYSGTREGHHSDHSRVKEQYVEHSGVR